MTGGRRDSPDVFARFEIPLVWEIAHMVCCLSTVGHNKMPSFPHSAATFSAVLHCML